MTNSDQPAAPEPSESDSPEAPEEVSAAMHLRKAPKYRTFIVLGAFVGIAFGLFLTVFAKAPDPEVADLQMSTLRFYFTVAGAMVGAIVGGSLAVWFDRAAIRRVQNQKNR